MGHTQLVDDWAQWATAGGAPTTTIRMRRHYLERFARAHDPRTATTDDIVEWLAAHEWAPNTRKSVRSTLIVFYRWALRAGYVEASPAEALPPVTVPRARAKPTPEPVYQAALMTRDERLALMVRLAGQLGLRRAEIARARRDDLEQGFTGWSLRVRGKGGHVRVLPVPDELARTLRRCPHGWLFPSPMGGHLTPDHVGRLLSVMLPIGYSGHSLRHRCGTRAYAATRDLLAVQELLGHARPETTQGYVMLPDDAVRAAVMAAAA